MDSPPERELDPPEREDDVLEREPEPDDEERVLPVELRPDELLELVDLVAMSSSLLWLKFQPSY